MLVSKILKNEQFSLLTENFPHASGTALQDLCFQLFIFALHSGRLAKMLFSRLP